MVSELNMLHGWRVSEADSSRLCSPTFLSLIACPRGFQSAYLLHCFSVARCGYTDTVIKCFLTVGNPYEELSEVVLFLDTEACSPPPTFHWVIDCGPFLMTHTFYKHCFAFHETVVWRTLSFPFHVHLSFLIKYLWGIPRTDICRFRLPPELACQRIVCHSLKVRLLQADKQSPLKSVLMQNYVLLSDQEDLGSRSLLTEARGCFYRWGW
jgi:hypothetical protein